MLELLLILSIWSPAEIFSHAQCPFHSLPSLAAILRCCYCYTGGWGRSRVNLWEHEQKKKIGQVLQMINRVMASLWQLLWYLMGRKYSSPFLTIFWMMLFIELSNLNHHIPAKDMSNSSNRAVLAIINIQ